jgi:2-polyprenyl-3-methyl-5-hydroxy-6-metoxy-1,4-benzoquinol methylase
MISGNRNVNHQEYVVRKYCLSRNLLNGLSIGCGTGSKEIEWARAGKFRNIDAYDLSPERIHAAMKTSATLPEGNIINYRVADFNDLILSEGKYDIVIFEHSLHHLSPLDSALQRISTSLKPGGLLIANEFIGPNRFQWTDLQLDAINSLLNEFPPKFKTFSGTTYLKKSVYRRSKLLMWLSDPSEGIESSDIVSKLSKYFNVLENRGYGGAILHLLYSDIAHHFITPDSTGSNLLNRSFGIEDALMERGKLTHDFAVVICNKSACSPA